MDFLFLLFGFLILAHGLYMTIQDRIQSKHGYHTQGKVIKLEGKWSWKGSIISYIFIPMVEFKNQSNKSMKLQLEASSSIPFYFEGQAVNIVYYKDKIYPTSIGWKLFNWLIILIGLTIIGYHVILLSDAGFWQNLYSFGSGMVKSFRYILR